MNDVDHMFLSPPNSWNKLERAGNYIISEYPVGNPLYEFNLELTSDNHFKVVPLGKIKSSLLSSDKEKSDISEAKQMLHKVSAYKSTDPLAPSLSILGPGIDVDTVDIKIVKLSEDPQSELYDIYYNNIGQGGGGVRISNKRSNHTLRRRIYHKKRISLNRNRRSGRRSRRVRRSRKN